MMLKFKADPRDRIHFTFDTTLELRDSCRRLLPRGRSNPLFNQILRTVVALAETADGQHALLSIELGLLNLEEAITTAARQKGLSRMLLIRKIDIGNTIIEEYEYQGRIIVFRNGQQDVHKTYEQLIAEETKEESADGSDS